MNRYVLSSYDLYLFKRMIDLQGTRGLNWSFIQELEEDEFFQSRKLKVCTIIQSEEFPDMCMCNKCSYSFDYHSGYHYCPNCGAKIVCEIGVQDD